MEEATGPVRWEHPPSKRGGRKAVVKKGCYMIEHDATGRFYVGTSGTVSQEIDKQISQLAIGKHPCKLLNELYSRDNVLRLHEYPVEDESDRKRLLSELCHQVGRAVYLCLNPSRTHTKKSRSPRGKSS